MNEKKSEGERRKRESSEYKEYHLLLSLSRHGEERLEAEYDNTRRHTSTHGHTNTNTQSAKTRVHKDATRA